MNLKLRKSTIAASALLAYGCLNVNAQEKALRQAQGRPNVMLIAIDDLNDWIGCMDGHPQAKTPNMARTSFGPGNYAIVSEDYRYIHYNDGSEEFYDRTKDQYEWNNVINNPEYAAIIKKHRAQVPQQRHEVLGQKSTGH